MPIFSKLTQFMFISGIFLAFCAKKKDEKTEPIANQNPATTNQPSSNTAASNSEAKCSVNVQPLAGDPYPIMFLKKKVVVAQDILINSGVYDFGSVDTAWIPSLYFQGGVQTKSPDSTKVYCTVQTYEDRYNSGKGFKQSESVIAIKSGTNFIVTDAGYANSYIGSTGNLVRVGGFVIKDKCSFDKYLYAVSCFKKTDSEEKQFGVNVSLDEAQAALGNFIVLPK